MFFQDRTRAADPFSPGMEWTMAAPLPFVLNQQNHDFVRRQKWQAAVLPFGATEPHNLHLPYGIDCFQVEAIATRACQHVWDAGAKVLQLPAVPFGVNTNYFQIPGAVALSVMPTTLLAILRDITDSLRRQGIKRLVLLNGHGGNELKPLLRQLHPDCGVFLALCDWFRMGADIITQIMEKPGEHADETETSLAMALVPDWVNLELADDGATRKSSIEAINKGWLSITRPWHIATSNTGVGDPSKSTAAKGEKLLEALAQRLGKTLYEVATTPDSELFPYT